MPAQLIIYGQLVELDGLEMACPHQPDALPVLERVLDLYPPLRQGEWAYSAAQVFLAHAGAVLVSYTADTSPEPEEGVTE